MLGKKVRLRRQEGQLTRREADFIDAYAENGGNREKAEKKAGLAPRGGYAVLARPEIQRQIVAAQLARLTNDALPLAVDTVISVMTNEKAPAAARVTAAKVVFDRILPETGDAGGKEAHEMTPEELAARINALTAAAASKAKDVTPEKPEESPFG